MDSITIMKILKFVYLTAIFCFLMKAVKFSGEDNQHEVNKNIITSIAMFIIYTIIFLD